MRQVNRVLRDYMASAIMRFVELPPGVVVSVTKVHTTADLRHSKVFISITPDQLSGSSLELIQRHAPEIMAAVGGQITWHSVPKFRFVLDDTERKAAHIEALLDKLKENQ